MIAHILPLLFSLSKV